LEFNLDNTYLRDVRMRHAITHAIDRQGITDEVWYGFGKPAIGPVPSTGARSSMPQCHAIRSI
jgi:peptide/nickel transport system substrate-binding protein